jgi:hypothetical protein
MDLEANGISKVDDLEKDWTWSKPFDLIVSRMMNGSFEDNSSIVAKAYEYVVPTPPTCNCHATDSTSHQAT